MCSIPASITSSRCALGDYLMDRFEVTNREFKAFVDSGGYRRRDLWEHPFVKDGQAAVVGRRRWR